MQERQVHSLGQEDPLEEEIATHSSILAWRIPGTEEPCGLQSKGWQRIRHNAAGTQGCRARRNQCGLSICGPDSGWAGEVRGSLGQGVELRAMRARVGAHHGGLKIFEHGRCLNIASRLGVPRLVSVSASVNHSPASPGGENESSGGQRWWRDGQTVHSPQVTQMESPRSRAALQGEMSPFLQ